MTTCCTSLSHDTDKPEDVSPVREPPTVEKETLADESGPDTGRGSFVLENGTLWLWMPVACCLQISLPFCFPANELQDEKEPLGAERVSMNQILTLRGSATEKHVGWNGGCGSINTNARTEEGDCTKWGDHCSFSASLEGSKTNFYNLTSRSVLLTVLTFQWEVMRDFKTIVPCSIWKPNIVALC